MIHKTYEYLAMFAVHTHSYFTITCQRTYNTMIFPRGSTVMYQWEIHCYIIIN